MPDQDPLPSTAAPRRLGDDVCLREIEVTTATVADAPRFLPNNPFLCLRPLPCDNPQHNTGNGYFGGLQFPTTLTAFGTVICNGLA